ncbi:MAG: insulinase family protein [Gemmatimonadaceae bacterium]|nr:insulinase family protein [Gemmatimonadaceae bacterium]
MTDTYPDVTSFIEPASVHRTVLPNGLTVLVRRDASAPVVAIVTHVKVGYFDETDDVTGIAHVLEHMFFKGTPSRGVGEIAKQTKASGGYLNAHTIYDNTSYYTVLPASGFTSGLEIQADAYAHCLIDGDELAKELEVIIQEAKRKADDPSALAVETLYELIHDVHRMRRWRIGREAGLRALNRTAMLRFYRNFYQPSNTILSIVGDVDVDDAIARVARLYGSLPASTPERSAGPAEPHREELRYHEMSGDIAQTQLMFGWRTPATMHEDTPALDVAGNLLAAGRASRLYRALRERQLASSVTAYNYTPTELGVFVVHAEMRPEKTVEAARAAWEQMRALREEPIDPFDLERVRRIFEARWIRRLESMEGQANHLTEWEALGGWQLGDDYFARFMSVTAEQVHEAARRYLGPDSAGMVVYRPASSPQVATDAQVILELMESWRPAALDPLPPRDIPAPATAAHSPDLEEETAGVSVFRTVNGMPILVRPKPGAAIAHLAIHAVGGARDEPAEMAGISTLVARTMTKGTTTRSAAQIAEDAEMLGGSVSPGVTAESFGWSISVPVQHLEAAAELLADVVQNATIPADSFETERTVALADLAALRDDMFRFPMRLVMTGAYGAHPYSRTPLGTEESLRALDVNRAREWYAAKMLSAPLVVGIVGDVIPDDVAGVVAREFAGLRPAAALPLARPQWPEKEVVLVDSRDKAQTALAIAFRGPGRRDDSRFAAYLTATIASGLGGRFFDELRDRQSLAYTVHAFTSQHELSGMFLAYIATSPEKEDIAREGLLAEFAKLRDAPVTDEELDRAKRYSIGSHAIGLESGAAILGEMLNAWLFGSGLRELEEHDRRLEAVTPAEIQALAQTFFDPARRVEGVVRGAGRVV